LNWRITLIKEKKSKEWGSNWKKNNKKFDW
jgi:hypothetical protein